MMAFTHLSPMMPLYAQDYRPFSTEAESRFQSEVEKFRQQTPTTYEQNLRRNSLENTLYGDQVEQPITVLGEQQTDGESLYADRLFGNRQINQTLIGSDGNREQAENNRGENRFEANGGEDINLEIDTERTGRRNYDRSQRRSEIQSVERGEDNQPDSLLNDQNDIAELEGRDNRRNQRDLTQNQNDEDAFERDFLEAERDLAEDENSDQQERDEQQVAGQAVQNGQFANRNRRRAANQNRRQRDNQRPIRQNGYDLAEAENNDITGSIRNDDLEDEYAQQGKRIGSFLLFPEITITGQYSDNPTASVNNAPGDSAIEILPSILARSDWTRHQLELQGQFRKNYYDELTSENIEEWLLGARGRLDIANNHYLELQSQIEQNQDSRGDIDNVNSDAELANVTTMMATAIYNVEWNRTTLRLRGNLTDYDYDDVLDGLGQTINNDDQDYLETNFSARLAYTLHPGFYVYGEGAYVKRDYDQALDDLGFQRGSDGETVTTGMIIDLTSKIRLEANIGYQWLFADDNRFTDVEEVVYSAAIIYRPSSQTSLRLSTSREIEGTDIDGTIGVLETDYRAELNHYFLPHILMTTTISYEIEEFDGINITEETLSTTLALQYIFNERARLIASYEFNDVRATGAGYEENIFRLGLNLRP